MSSHPVFARLYGRFAPAAEQAGTGEHRDELLAGLRGRVIEVGAGSGLCFAHYPNTVDEVVAIEPEPYLRRLAEKAVGVAPIPVRVIAGTADNLPADDESFDAAVASLVLCSIPDPRRALEEIHRVLHPGGSLRFYEHVRSSDPRQAHFQDRIDGIWPFFCGGCHVNRESESAISAAGFSIERSRRFDFRPCAIAAPASPHIIGEAVRL